ncbi:hypothetical protein NBRC13296_02115 [Paenibacillus chitinolyticus]|uniref:hypothetical protein n=1 Tax=Paenibacillus chitinolyticus TaxID=79263 RepID=UPI003557210D
MIRTNLIGILIISKKYTRRKKLGQQTTHVPVGKNFDNFTDAAVDALLEKQSLRDKYRLTSDSNDMAAMMAFAETYNGLGYYNWRGSISIANNEEAEEFCLVLKL